MNLNTNQLKVLKTIFPEHYGYMSKEEIERDVARAFDELIEGKNMLMTSIRIIKEVITYRKGDERQDNLFAYAAMLETIEKALQEENQKNDVQSK